MRELIVACMFSSETVNNWSASKYPDYIEGICYVMSARTVNRLLNAARFSKPLTNDDVFFTGLVAEMVGVKRVNTPGLVVHV